MKQNLKKFKFKNIRKNSQAGIIFTLLGAAADEVEEEEKKRKKGEPKNLNGKQLPVAFCLELKGLIF